MLPFTIPHSCAISVARNLLFLTRWGIKLNDNNPGLWIMMPENFPFEFYLKSSSANHVIQLSSKVSLHIEKKHWKKGAGSCPKYFCQNCQNLPLPNLSLYLKHFKQVHSSDGTELIPIKRKRSGKAGCLLSTLIFMLTTFSYITGRRRQWFSVWSRNHRSDKFQSQEL